jgi:hypothetical protein
VILLRGAPSIRRPTTQEPYLMTHAQAVARTPHFEGRDCPGRLVEASPPHDDIHILDCTACGLRISYDDMAGAARNVYRPLPAPGGLVDQLARRLDVAPLLPPPADE